MPCQVMQNIFVVKLFEMPSAGKLYCENLNAISESFFVKYFSEFYQNAFFNRVWTISTYNNVKSCS